MNRRQRYRGAEDRSYGPTGPDGLNNAYYRGKGQGRGHGEEGSSYKPPARSRPKADDEQRALQN